MSRTKEEMAVLLASKKHSDMFKSSTWADLVRSISGATPQQRQRLVDLLVKGNTKKAGEALRNALLVDAKDRAKAFVDEALIDDSLSLEELDQLL